MPTRTKRSGFESFNFLATNRSKSPPAELKHSKSARVDGLEARGSSVIGAEQENMGVS